jgi:phage tail-like protein
MSSITKKFSVNVKRYDPYRNFKFRIKWDGKYVAGVSKVTALKKTTEVVEFRQGGDSSVVYKLPGKTKYEAITIEAGLTHDPTFEEWANLVNNIQGDKAMSLKDFRKEIEIEVLNEQGNIAMKYNVHRCWVSEYQSLPDLDANANAVALMHVKIENEGWEKDHGVPEPTES